MNTPMPPFRRLLPGAHQMCYQNTVAVHVNGAMWLGFIQDIDGDRVFIDFDSKKAEARWFEAACVYILPSYYQYQNRQRDRPIYAALRDEDDGPFRFQSVVVLHAIAQGMYYVRTNAQCITSSNSVGVRTELVDECQILGPEWFTAPTMVQRGRGLLYTKYFVPFMAMAHQVLSEPADRSRIIKHFRDAFGSDGGLGNLTDCCRFHLRVLANGCVFVVIGVGRSADAQRMTFMKLAIMLPRHVWSRAGLLPIRFDDGSSIGIDDFRMESSCSATCLGYLPHWIFSEIFSYLDLHSHMKLQRVCALWHELLRHPRATEHIRVCLDSMTRKTTSDNCNAFRVAMLLMCSIKAATKSLTVITRSLGDHECFLVSLLKAMEAVEVHLPLLILKNFTVDRRGRSVRDEDFKMVPSTDMTADVVLFEESCERIVLHNWKVSHLFGRVMYKIFVDNRFNFRNLHPLPRRERDLMRPLGWGHVLAIDHSEITVPRVVLDCREGQPNMVSRILWAVNEHFPPVTQEMHTKVRAIYARWVRCLAYPAEWETVRCYLSRFSGFHSDGTPRSWVNVDLRLVDPGDLSKMALHGINEVFLVGH
ncbi:uncharacterized protein LOC129587943 [Paramacrobiotus metropolitanus]|uniref:uncharacterized protein LOC129587943 n=1 Tax=Paramacrobiotus metropolitanus TaxID=2943436 RepID=UPI0024460731|nr:uncharacterized protein LOC129587943 [Paramacrobiotus metropolitanus]